MEKRNIPKIKFVYDPGIDPSNLPVITTAEQAYVELLKSWDCEQMYLLHEAKIMYLNSGNRCLGIDSIAKAGIGAIEIDFYSIFSRALTCNASAIILARNYISGNVTPSETDLEAGNKLHLVGSLLNINVFDWIILNSNNYFSFETEGLFSNRPGNIKTLKDISLLIS